MPEGGFLKVTERRLRQSSRHELQVRVNKTQPNSTLIAIEGATALFCVKCWRHLATCPTCSEPHCWCNLRQTPFLKPSERRIMPKLHYDRDFTPYPSPFGEESLKGGYLDND